MRRILSATFTALLAMTVFAQDLKQLEDTMFTSGDRIRIPDLVYCTHSPPYGICSESVNLIGTVARFLDKHSTINAVIEVHTDTRGSSEMNDHLSLRRAEVYRTILVNEHGVDPERLKPMGIGEREPLVPEEEISAVTALEEKERLHAINRRYVLRIL